MWLLITSTEKLIYLKPNIPVSIGRKKGDILLPHDASISKLHASIIVKPHIKVMAGKPTSLCILKDEGSKYGTYISKNGIFEKITTDINLKDQDVMRIGLQREIFTVKYIPIITMVSTLQDSEKDKLLEIMDVIDGVITTDWDKYCTHLTVVKPKLTQKVAISLAAGLPIVNIDYWNAVKSIIEKGDLLPEIDNFIPEISEQYISKNIASLSPNNERKILFTDLTFNFFSLNQYEVYRTMINLAGGKSVLINSNNKPNNVLKRNYIFVQYSSTDSTQFTENYIQEYDYIRKILNTHKCRVIPESEIPLAILHCSTKRYCNPRYNFGYFLKREEKRNCDLPETLVIDTQDQDILIQNDRVVKENFCHKKNKNYVAETVESDDDDVSTQDNEMSQENLGSPKELISKVEYIVYKKLFIPETVESSYDSQRNADDHTKQNLNYDSFNANIDNNLKTTHTSTNATFEEKHSIKLSDKDNNEQVTRLHTKEVHSLDTQICIPETFDDDDSDSFRNSNKKYQTINASSVLNNVSKENDSNDVSIRNQVIEDNENTLITVLKLSETGVTKNVQSHETEMETEMEVEWITVNSPAVTLLEKTNTNKTSPLQIRRNPPGKTFKKAYVKIPEKRLRLMNIGNLNE